MIRRFRRFRRLNSEKRSPLFICVICAICGSFAFEAPAQPTSQPQGLDALSEDRVYSELASRGLNKLLDRAFDANQVPQSLRDGVRALASLQRLADAKLTAAQRREMIARIADGIEQALPGINDPKALMAQASALIQFGAERDVNTLEFWGANAKTQAALKPIVLAAAKLLDKAASLSQKRADDLANQITSPNDPKAAQWERASEDATAAAYTRHMLDYYIALSLEASDPQRAQIAAEAIDYLKQFDNADSAVQPVIRLRTGKLCLAKADYSGAMEAFASLIDPSAGVTPAPDATQQWEARYFTAVAQLLAGQLDASQKSLDETIAWQQANLPKDRRSQDGAAAATSMLQYRIHSARNDNEKAVAILIDLVKKRPELQSIIFDQLMSRLPKDADLKTLDVLLLQGFVARADEERTRPPTEAADEQALQRGVDAAREVLRRRKASADSVDPQLAETDALLLGFFLERLGKHADAADAMLDYLTGFTGNTYNNSLALENAQSIIARLRADPSTANLAPTVAVYERFLPIAIAPPFSRIEFAFEYARRLQLNGKYKEAIDLYRQVPAKDKRLASARFFEMVALQQLLDEGKLSAEQRKTVSTDLIRVMADTRAKLTDALSAAPTDREKLQYKSMLVRTTLLNADLARREQNDPKQTLALLQNFESIAQGLPNEKDLIANVLYTRVQAYMALGDSDSATRTLVALLSNTPGSEGAGIVYRLLQKLNAELDQARAAGNRTLMQTLSRNRAQLSGFLVQWARSNPDPNIKKFTYRYSVFDAATKHQAAELEDDPAKRKAGLEAALKLYRQLESPESVELYKATLDPNSPERNNPDPAVSLGIGLLAYDLADYADAQKRLGQLLTQRKLGTPTTTVEEDGQVQLVFNDQYWEATLRLLRSNLALAAANPSDPTAQSAKTETVNYLKELLIRWGKDLGGKKWSPEFEKLRVELIPDFNPDQPATTTP